MMAALNDAQQSKAQDDVLALLRTAERLETENPRWIVVFGVYSRQFVAFPRFSVPVGTMATARYPADLEERMCQIEAQAGIIPESRKRNDTGKGVG